MDARIVSGQLVNVLLVDDHPAIRGGVAAALRREPDIKVIGEADNGLDAEELAVELHPDVIVMDVYMPGRDGIRTLLSIKQRLPGVKIILFTVSERGEDLFQAVRLGADGYILKHSSLEEVVKAVRDVASGHAIISPEMTVKVLEELRTGGEKPLLAQREQQVLDLLAEGLTNAQIAEKLTVSRGTISTYVFRLLQKLHLKNRGEAIAYALRTQGRRESL